MTINEFGRRSFITHTTGLKERIQKAEKEIQMREIKFRAWADGKMHYDNFSIEFNGGEMDTMIAYTQSGGKVVTCEDFILMQFTGLKDKNGLTDIYEYDIIGVDGLIKGNQYENPNLLQDKTNLVVPAITSEDWQEAYGQAMVRGCKHAK